MVLETHLSHHCSKRSTWLIQLNFNSVMFVRKKKDKLLIFRHFQTKLQDSYFIKCKIRFMIILWPYFTVIFIKVSLLLGLPQSHRTISNSENFQLLLHIKEKYFDYSKCKILTLLYWFRKFNIIMHFIMHNQISLHQWHAYVPTYYFK